MSFPRLPDYAISKASARFCKGLELAAPALVPSGRRLLSRIATPNWTLEWSLPGWLGDAFGLAPETSTGLVLANAYGLAYVRLIDDLVDGDGAGFEPAETVLLAGAMYSLWIAQLREVVGGEGAQGAGWERAGRFWRRFEQYRSQWLGALPDERLPSAPFHAYSEAHFRRLAARGAPLKVCCAAACTLGARERDLPALEDAIDQLLVGAVLLDHARDWPEDLAAGRANAFVAYASSLPQIVEHQEANQRAALEAILLRDGARSYFSRIGTRFRAAGEAAQALQCAGLVTFLVWLNGETEAYAARLRDGARAQLQAAVRAFMDPPSGINQANF